MKKIVVIGGGSWGTAIANMLAATNDTVIVSRNSFLVDSINNMHRNTKYFANIPLNPNLRAVYNDYGVVSKNDIIINAIPTQSIRKLYTSIQDYIFPDNLIVNLSKGIEVHSGKRISSIFYDIFPDNTYSVVSGPSHAEEVILLKPTAVVAASDKKETVDHVQNLFMNDFFRVYTSVDVLGVELGGALKNIIALGLGIANGLGYGDNSKAALMTRGIHEIVRFAVKQGARAETLYGLSGLGDVIVTCSSKHSRNWQAGNFVGQGFTLTESQKKVGMAVEGVETTRAVYELSQRLNIEMPITEVIYGILYNNANINDAVDQLMLREKKSEFDL